MAGETVITVVGNLVSDPEMRATPSGVMVTKFSVASTPRTFDKQSGDWRDGEPLYLRCNAWRDLAEHIADTLTKGMRVIVQGRLTQNNYEKDGVKKTSYELTVDEVGPSLRYATAKVEKVARQADTGGFGGQRDRNAGAPRGGPTTTSNFDDEPPF